MGGRLSRCSCYAPAPSGGARLKLSACSASWRLAAAASAWPACSTRPGEVGGGGRQRRRAISGWLDSRGAQPARTGDTVPQQAAPPTTPHLCLPPRLRQLALHVACGRRQQLGQHSSVRLSLPAGARSVAQAERGRWVEQRGQSQRSHPRSAATRSAADPGKGEGTCGKKNKGEEQRACLCRC